MSDETIPPVLSAEEWRDVQRGATNSGMVVFFLSHFARVERYNAAAAIANAALPDDHPGKLTWADVEWLRSVLRPGHTVIASDIKTLHAIAGKLAALLPPRAPLQVDTSTSKSRRDDV